MSEPLYFSDLVTKSLQPINSDDRYFEGYLTVQVKDKQGEITIVDELYKVLPVWMDRGAPISDTHSNRIVGKGINYSKTTYVDKDGSEYPAIKITGKIHKNYELDHEIWSKIKSGEYKGLSFGGATRTNREPIVMKDGSIAYALKELEHYEVAVCRDPAVPLALITDHNNIAKAMAGYSEDREDGKMIIKCSKFGCFIEKGDENLILDDKSIEILEKADLGKYDTFDGKVGALVKEGYPEENAKRIVGAFVKGEKKKDGEGGADGGTVTTSTEGVNNPVYGEKKKKTEQLDPDPENEDPEAIMSRAKVVGRKQEMYKADTLSGGTRHASEEYKQGSGESTQITRDTATGADEETSEKPENNTGSETMHNLYNQDEPDKPSKDESKPSKDKVNKMDMKIKTVKLESSVLINRLKQI